MEKYQEVVDPGFIKVRYDNRNVENAGKFRGVGDPAKVGSNNCTSYDPMPSECFRVEVKRDHEG